MANAHHSSHQAAPTGGEPVKDVVGWLAQDGGVVEAAAQHGKQ
jgi:hypothetical protein